MKTFLNGNKVSVLAAAPLSKNLFIGFDGNLCGANAKALGVCELDTASGEMAAVQVDSVVLVKSGAALTAGNAVVSDAASKAIAATAFSVTVPAGAVPVTSDGAQPNLVEAGSVLPQYINGYTLDDAAGANELVRVKLV